MAGDDRGVHGRVEHREPVLARLLGRVHRDVRVAQQVVGLVARREAGGDPDAGRDLEVLSEDREGDRERGDEARRDGHGGTQLGLVEQQHRELVAAEASGHVPGPHARLDALGDGGEQPVAGRMAHGVVDVLEVVEVEEQHDRHPARRRVLDGSVDLLGEQAAVGEPGQRVVVGLEPELLLESRELRERLLELAVLERDGGLVGERLEQPQVIVRERRPLGQAVGDDHRPDQPGLAQQWRRHRVPHGGVVPVGRQVQERPPIVGDAPMQPVGIGQWQRDHRRRHAILFAHGEQALGDGVVARPQQHLRALGAEHLAGVVEQGGQRRVQLGRVLEDPARLVEQLQPLVLLAFRDVRAVGEEHGHQGHDQERQQQRVEPQHRHGQQREARVGDRDQPAELDHLRQLLVLRGAPGHRDRRGDGQRAEDGGTRRGGECGRPVGRVRHAVRGLEQVEHRQRGGRGEREVGQVERQLERRLAVDEQRGAGPHQHGQEVVVRGEQEIADDGGELAQRERVLLAPEMDVDDLQLGREERRRHEVPRDRDGRLDRGLPAQEEDVQDRRDAHQQGAEQGDPDRRRDPACQPAARVHPTSRLRSDDAWLKAPLPGAPVRVEHLALHPAAPSGRRHRLGPFYA
jgi:hypothetical protein